MDIESQETLDAVINAAVPKLQTALETVVGGVFENLNLLAKRLDGTIIQSDPITISIPKLTVWLKLPKESE